MRQPLLTFKHSRMQSKITLLFVLFFCSFFKAEAQFKHYLSHNGVFYFNYFNKEKDKSLGLKSLLSPNLSYKIEMDKSGLEVFYYFDFSPSYHPRISEQSVPVNTILQMSTFDIGVAYHYNILDKKYLKISPMVGVIKNWHESMTVLKWYPNEAIIGGNKESKFGLLSGVNINAPIWNGIYANTNARYSVFPTGQYNKQNLVVDIGVGYMYQNKKKNKAKK